jgi:hypothetical protein
MLGEQFNIKTGIVYSVNKWKVTPTFRIGFQPYFDFTPNPNSKEQRKEFIAGNYRVGDVATLPFEPKGYGQVGVKFKTIKQRIGFEINSGLHFGNVFFNDPKYNFIPSLNLILGYVF